MSKYIGKNISKDLSSKSGRNLLIMLISLLQKRANQKTTKATGDLIGNKIADKIIKVSKTTPQNNSETVESETENARFDQKDRKL